MMAPAWRWETGAAPGKGLGPHPAPGVDSSGWASVWWPEYTTRPIPYFKASKVGAFIGLQPSDRPMDPSQYAAVFGDSYFTAPGKEKNGSAWPLAYMNGQPSGNPKAPVLAFGKLGKPAKPATPPPAPFTGWSFRAGWRWTDTGPGFWLPVGEWYPVVLAGSVEVKPTASEVKITDPGSGESYTWRSDDPDALPWNEWLAAFAGGKKAKPGAGSGIQSDREKSEAAAFQATLDAARGSGSTWLWIGGAVVAAWLLARKGGRRA